MSERAVQLAYLKRRISRPLARLLGEEPEPAARARPLGRVTSGSRRPARDEHPALRRGGGKLARAEADKPSFDLLDLGWLENALDDAEDTLGRLVSNGVPASAIWVPSFLALGAADVVSSTRGVAVSSKAVNFLGAAGGLGLIAGSLRDLQKAKTLDEHLDAGNDLAWGTQGLLYLSSAPLASKVGLGFGLVGSLAQSWVGARRISRGWREHDGEELKLGALDLGGGLLWLSWDVAGVGSPIFVASYVAVMIGREAYVSRAALKRFGAKLAHRIKGQLEGLPGPAWLDEDDDGSGALDPEPEPVPGG